MRLRENLNCRIWRQMNHRHKNRIVRSHHGSQRPWRGIHGERSCSFLRQRRTRTSQTQRRFRRRSIKELQRSSFTKQRRPLPIEYYNRSTGRAPTEGGPNTSRQYAKEGLKIPNGFPCTNPFSSLLVDGLGNSLIALMSCLRIVPCCLLLCCVLRCLGWCSGIWWGCV